jgi:hypothetical protein
VRDQFHAPAALHWGKNPSYQLDRSLGELQSQSGCGGKEKNPNTCQELNPGHSAHSLVTILWSGLSPKFCRHFWSPPCMFSCHYTEKYFLLFVPFEMSCSSQDQTWNILNILHWAITVVWFDVESVSVLILMLQLILKIKMICQYNDNHLKILVEWTTKTLCLIYLRQWVVYSIIAM